jgi:hypothetical protein
MRGEVVEKMKRVLVWFALVGTAGLVVVGASSGATVRGITPFVASGYPSCAEVGAAGTNSVTFTRPVNGASSNGIYLLVDSSTSFGWYVLPEIQNVGVRTIIVKGGPNSNVYVYPGGDYSDGPITAPKNPKNGKLYDVGSATFCFNVAS